MDKNVFLSYSWKDRHIAMRLYDDLIRSNVPIWRDQIDGDPTTDFQKEFLEKIDNCNFFIMLDSINYRERSNWCCVEAQRCLDVQKKRNNLKIIVCILNEEGQWRTAFNNKSEQFKNVFEQINKLKYQKLFYTGYDDFEVYNNALNFICGLLGTRYERWDKLPSYQDFMDELKEVSSPNEIDDTTETILLDGYKTILFKIRKNYPHICDSFKVWINDCLYSHSSLFFPKWTYAVWLANQLPNYSNETLDIFTQLTRSHPDDPRSYRGLGNISAYIGNTFYEKGQIDKANEYYHSAISALHKAEQLMEQPENMRHKEICLFEVLKNMGVLYHIIQKKGDALVYQSRALEVMIQNGFFSEELVNDFFLTQIEEGYPFQLIKDWLYNLITHYPLESLPYQLLGLSYVQLEDFQASMEMLHKAYSLNPSMENLYHLLNIKINTNMFTLSEKDLVKKIVTQSMDNDEEIWVDEIKKIIGLPL